MKNHHFIFLILSLSVTIFAAFIYGYMYNMVSASSVQTAKYLTAINSAAVAKSREQSFLQTYEETASKWASLPGFFVESSKIVDYIDTVESLGKKSGSEVVISSIDADNLDNATPGTEGLIRIHVSTKGPWGAVMQALSLAEVMPYKISINNVVANSASGAIDATKTKPSDLMPKTVWSLSFDMVTAMIKGEATSTTQ